MSKLIRTLLIGIAPIPLLALSVEVYAQDDVDCNKCVDTSDIARHAVNSNKIAKQAITTGKIAKQAVTTSKIAKGAVTVNKVAPELSNAIGMFCLPDETVVGMETDGTFACEVPQTLASDGEGNTRAGSGALSVNTTGAGNTAIGTTALLLNTTGHSNTAVGFDALQANITGLDNTAVGAFALLFNTTGDLNTAIGAHALEENTTAIANTAVGFGTLWKNTTGHSNTAIGVSALEKNTTGISNTAIGTAALRFNTTGSDNIAIGTVAGVNLTIGSNNIAIGHSGIAAEANTNRIGSTQTRTFIAGIRGSVTGTDNAMNVVIDSDGQLGTISSSRRYKEEIYDMETASERLLNLRPVTFRYKKAFEDGDKPVQFGLIAEEVAEVFPELVVYNEDGAPEAVKYRLLSTLLLNELQKEYRVNQRQEAQLQDMQTRLEHLEKAKSGAVASIE